LLSQPAQCWPFLGKLGIINKDGTIFAVGGDWQDARHQALSSTRETLTMFVCPDCANAMEQEPGQAKPETCTCCGARLRPQATHAWVDVARVTNLAEAGFLCDELTGLDIDARVYQSDDYSERGGGWTTTYLIRVPSDVAQHAAAQIRAHVAEAAAEEELNACQFGYAGEIGPMDPTYWRPVAVVVLAGVASFVLGRQTALPEGPRRPTRDSLATAVDAIGQPLLTQPVPGQPRYQLSFDRSRQAWQLDTDRNGDGIFEAHRQFQTSGAAR
jgi:hypothetical protein